MSKKTKSQTPRKPKTKEEIAQEIKAQAEAKRFRKLVKEQLYPILLESCKSIADAEMTLAVIGMAIQQSLLQKQKSTKVSDLPNLEVSKDFEHFNKILNLFKEESVADSMKILEGLNETLKGAVREENTKRKLDTLVVQLLD